MSDAGAEDVGEVTPETPPTETPEPTPEVESVPASDAFDALGNEVRMAVLRALVDDADESVSGTTMTFSELFEESSADTTAGFAYHLRQLTDLYLRKTGEEEDRYALTYAGLQVARAIVAGTYTDRVSFGPVEMGEDCPLCEDGNLAATCEANYVTVACTDCRQGILTLPFPPGAQRDRDTADLLEAFDRHHRHRLSVMSDGICPECAAKMDATLALVGKRQTGTSTETDADSQQAQVTLDCQQCGCELNCPVTLAVLEHPAVIAFYHDHGENVRDRPIWNVGDEWRETVLSTDPWCVRVSAQLDDEELGVFVAGDLTVAETRRRNTQQAS
ncbi:winged helix-turn-helix domain-containing protein [Halorussus halophilus]|uniref:winged helix-turn-helix domain-containing protein n=1 Tax=Halorussus halophilus TaxID=2650975 RepID=UPI0013014D51|nr:helix-turn-helix domain-containing protein [Halorussus halophilus]